MVEHIWKFQTEKDNKSKVISCILTSTFDGIMIKTCLHIEETELSKINLFRLTEENHRKLLMEEWRRKQ